MDTHISHDATTEQFLQELKSMSADLQLLKKTTSDIARELHITHEEVRSLPTGTTWAGPKRP